jgi:hypothetical protein
LNTLQNRSLSLQSTKSPLGIHIVLLLAKEQQSKHNATRSITGAPILSILDIDLIFAISTRTTDALEIAVYPHEGHALRYRAIHPVVKDLEELLYGHLLRPITSSLNP